MIRHWLKSKQPVTNGDKGSDHEKSSSSKYILISFFIFGYADLC